MKTEPDGIKIPAHFVKLCGEWHNGQSCLLYAVQSAGNLTMGTDRPAGCDSAEKWYLNIWQALDSDLSAIVRTARRIAIRAEVKRLEEFATYVDGIVDKLAVEYGLEDWEPEF